MTTVAEIPARAPARHRPPKLTDCADRAEHLRRLLAPVDPDEPLPTPATPAHADGWTVTDHSGDAVTPAERPQARRQRPSTPSLVRRDTPAHARPSTGRTAPRTAPTSQHIRRWWGR